MLDASGIIHIKDDLFLVAEDEKDILPFFTLDIAAGRFNATGNVIHFGDGESDFESLAYDPVNLTYYAIGSHGHDYSKRLVSFQLEDQSIVHTSEINFDSSFFFNEPVNIEALTVWKSRLFLGLRSPVKAPHALAIVFDPNTNTQLLTGFDLDGRTFRDMVRIDDENFLILAGPERGKHYEKLTPVIIWWNGDLFQPKLQTCQIDLGGFRAEGIAIRRQPAGEIDILLGSDQSRIKDASGFRILLIQVASIDELLTDQSMPIELAVQL